MSDSIRAGYGMDRKNKGSSQAPDPCPAHNGPRYCYEITKLRRELEAERKKRERYEAVLAEKDYDPGLLGGENMGSDQQTTWWQDYIRAEIGRCNDYWRELLEEALKGGEDEG